MDVSRNATAVRAQPIVGCERLRITEFGGSKVGMRAATETNVLDVPGIQRREGSVGLVVFERDGILLQRRERSGDLALGDIDIEFLAMLQDMRALNVRFGFISYHTTSPFDRGDGIDCAALTRLLDSLLSVSGALPDFWVEATHLTIQRQAPQRSGSSDIDVISKLAQWYDVDPQMTVVVRKRQFDRSSKKTPAFTEILYPGSGADVSFDIDTEATLVWLKTAIKHALQLP